MRMTLGHPAAIAACLLLPSVAGAQERSVYDRIQALDLDTLTMKPVTTWFAEKDSARAIELTSLLRAATRYFEGELGVAFDVRLAALPEGQWVSDIPVGDYTIPHEVEAERMIVVPTSGVRLPGRPFTRAIDFITLHEYGHLATTRYFRSGRWDKYAPHWFEEFLATYWAYAFVRRSDPEWADSLLRDWSAGLANYTPPKLSLDWSFMRSLPPEEMGRVYGWYQVMLNLRVAKVYAEHGLDFLPAALERLSWSDLEAWTTPSLLRHLDAIAPGFQEWEQRLRSGTIGVGRR